MYLARMTIHLANLPFRSQTGYDRLLCQLAQVEFAATKSSYASSMMQQELHNYEAISHAIDGGIEQAKRQIGQSKENLVLAKQIRKNRMEYDVLAKIISAQPDRKKTTDKLDILRTELNELQGSRQQLQSKFQVRQNDFAVLMRSIRELQAKLDVRTDGDDDDDAGDEAAANSIDATDTIGPSAYLSNMTETIDDDDEDEIATAAADGGGGAADVEMVSTESNPNLSNGSVEI